MTDSSSKLFEDQTLSAQDALFPEVPSTPKPVEGNWREMFSEFVGSSPKINKTLETISKYAKSDGAVLISGESGTGKELVASAIHRLSNRSSGNFVALNCSAIPADLLESELFGHTKGAFTGADRNRQGKFELANGGSLFLDEIGDMPMQLQAKLLRVIQEMEFTPVGSNIKKKINVRIIAATNINLQDAIEQQRFRLDLYYRLNVLPIKIPPLKERVSDTPLLLEHFLKQVNFKRPADSQCWFSADAMQALSQYDWPGNIRQLQNVVERMVVFKVSGCMHTDDIPEDIKDHLSSNQSSDGQEIQTFRNTAASPLGRSIAYPTNFGNIKELPENGINLTKYIEDIENNLIIQALEKTNNNKQQAAKLLGLNRTTLVERIKKRKISMLNNPSKEL